ncbi:MAG: phosphotransferase [Tumebacillaceae bacterium]
MSSNIESLLEAWDALRLDHKFSVHFGSKIKLVEDSVKRIKKQGRSIVWQLEVADHNYIYPMFLKIYADSYPSNQVEINIYTKAYPFLHEFLPMIYHVEPQATKRNGKTETWVFMEHLKPLNTQIKMEPVYYFDHVIPALAEMHAHTFEEEFYKHQHLFTPWLPDYLSTELQSLRKLQMDESRKNLDKLMRKSEYKELIRPYYSLMQRILKRGPDFFPELVFNGLSLTHGDLHEKNICSLDATGDEWSVQYIDWEGAEFAPVWYDVALLVEVLIDYRDDWHSREEELRQRGVQLYVKEMEEWGIQFGTDPMKLYKMGYLQWMLEKGLYNELNDALDGREAPLLKRYFEKTKVWGKELGLY